VPDARTGALSPVMPLRRRRQQLQRRHHAQARRCHAPLVCAQVIRHNDAQVRGHAVAQRQAHHVARHEVGGVDAPLRAVANHQALRCEHAVNASQHRLRAPRLRVRHDAGGKHDAKEHAAQVRVHLRTLRLGVDRISNEAQHARKEQEDEQRVTELAKKLAPLRLAALDGEPVRPVRLRGGERAWRI
jgi:hypothetical protein